MPSVADISFQDICIAGVFPEKLLQKILRSYFVDLFVIETGNEIVHISCVYELVDKI